MFDDARTRNLCLLFIVPAMLGLRMHNIVAYSNVVNGRNIDPLCELLLGFSQDRLYDSLLNRDETYDHAEESATFVRKEDKIRALCTALFITHYDSMQYRTCIGTCVFNEDLRKFLLRIVNLMSEYTDFAQ